MQSKQGKEAGEELEKTVEIDPGFTLAYCQLGHAKLGDRAKAEQALAELKKLHQQELDESSAVDEDAPRNPIHADGAFSPVETH